MCRRKSIKTCQKRGWHHISREKLISCKGVNFHGRKPSNFNRNPFRKISSQILHHIRHNDQQKKLLGLKVSSDSCAPYIAIENNLLFFCQNFANVTTPLHYSKTIDEWSTLSSNPSYDKSISITVKNIHIINICVLGMAFQS